MSRGTDGLLLGEWACLGILTEAPAHGFAVAARLRADADIGRVWSLSRALTYRAIDQLTSRGLISPVAAEQGIAGGQRTVFAATAAGRALLVEWLSTPVQHLRDLRSELLLKLVLCHACGVDARPLLLRQREVVERMAAAFGSPTTGDVVGVWRCEASQAAVRFVIRLLDTEPSVHDPLPSHPDH